MWKLDEGENIIKVLRRHYWVMLPITIGLIFMAVFPLLFCAVIYSGIIPFDPTITDAFINFLETWEFKIFSYSLYLLVLWVFFFIEWTDYYLDVWVVTDKRIIDIEQKGFFHREITSFHYEQIQDITIETKGFIETLLKFGTLHVETAGVGRNITIKNAYHPEDAQLLILTLQKKAVSSKSGL